MNQITGKGRCKTCGARWYGPVGESCTACRLTGGAAAPELRKPADFPDPPATEAGFRVSLCRYCGKGFTTQEPNVSAVPEQGAYHWGCFNRAGYQDGVSQRQARFEVMERSLTNLLHDLRILSGEIVGPSGVSWQDVAGTAAVNAQVLADQLTQARAGNSHGAITFPSPSECLEGKGGV